MLYHVKGLVIYGFELRSCELSSTTVLCNIFQLAVILKLFSATPCRPRNIILGMKLLSFSLFSYGTFFLTCDMNKHFQSLVSW